MDPMASPSIDIQLPKDQVPRMEESSYKLYGYGLCKGKPSHKIANKYKVQETLQIRYFRNFRWSRETPHLSHMHHVWNIIDPYIYIHLP